MKPSNLTKDKVISILQEEYAKKIESSVKALFESSLHFEEDEEKEEDDEKKEKKVPKLYHNKIGDLVMSKGLLLKHVDTGVQYKVVAVSPSGVVLDPGGENVDKKRLEKEFLIK